MSRAEGGLTRCCKNPDGATPSNRQQDFALCPSAPSRAAIGSRSHAPVTRPSSNISDARRTAASSASSPAMRRRAAQARHPPRWSFPPGSRDRSDPALPTSESWTRPPPAPRPCGRPGSEPAPSPGTPANTQTASQPPFKRPPLSQTRTTNRGTGHLDRLTGPRQDNLPELTGTPDFGSRHLSSCLLVRVARSS